MDLKRILKALPTGFQAEADALSPARLRTVIVEAETHIREVEHERDGDEALSAAREQAKDLGAGYREAITCQRAKIAYALHLLAEKGEI